MADSYHVDSNVTTQTGVGGSSAVSVTQSNVIESSRVVSNITTGGRGATGATGATGPAGANGQDGADAPSDHTLLSNIGTNTHAQIDTAISASASHIANTSNPHSVTKTQVGLGNVDNTADTAKPVSTAQQTALDAKQPLDADLTALAAANNSTVLANTTASFTTADETKLDGIEALADVTDATNVTAAGAVMTSGAQTVAGVKTFSSDPLIPDEAYGVGWNGSLEPPTKNAVYDKVESLVLGGGGAAWGGITGTLSDQTDLQTELDDKLNLSGGTMLGNLDFNTATWGLILNSIASADEGSAGAAVDGVLFYNSDDHVVKAIINGVLTPLATTDQLGVQIADTGGFTSIIEGNTTASYHSFKSLQSSDNSVTITDNGTDIDFTTTGVSGAWGGITGTLSDQTDLQNELDDKQPLDSDLTTLAGLTATTDNFIVSVSSAWASRTPSQVRTTLGLVIGTNVQAWDADLDTWAGKTAPSGTVLGTTDTQTLTNKRITKRTSTEASSATPTINTDNVDFHSITALAANITSFTTNLTGTPTEGQTLWIAITGTATRTIAWGASFEASTVALPTTTVSTNRLDVGFIWNTVTSKWRCVAVV